MVDNTPDSGEKERPRLRTPGLRTDADGGPLPAKAVSRPRFPTPSPSRADPESRGYRQRWEDEDAEEDEPYISRPQPVRAGLRNTRAMPKRTSSPRLSTPTVEDAPSAQTPPVRWWSRFQPKFNFDTKARLGVVVVLIILGAIVILPLLTRNSEPSGTPPALLLPGSAPASTVAASPTYTPAATLAATDNPANPTAASPTLSIPPTITIVPGNIPTFDPGK